MKKQKQPKAKKCIHYWMCNASTFCEAHSHRCKYCGAVRKQGDIIHANIDGR
jgi:hypothetical protein